MDVHGGGTGDAGKLQRTAASAAVVLNEIVYGASGVWVDDPAEAGIELGARGSSTEHSADLLPFVMTIVREYTSPEIWELPTDMHSSRLLAAVEKGLEISGSRPREHLKMDEELKLPTREMGLVEPTPYSQLHDNAILQTVLLEGLAVFARALGRRFVSEGGLLACTLQQVLDKLGDPHPSVSEAAKLTLDSICVFCGYPSPRKLIAANADYVVDALCRNLHHLELHPRTPDLFVAVLRQTGAAPDLLPLLREPMAAILRSLEVNGRRRQPQHTVSFLLALRELTGAAEKDLMVVAGKSNFAAKEAERQAARKIEMRSQGRKRAAMEKWRKLAEGREKAGEYRPTKEDPDKDYWEFAASVEEDSEGDDEAQSVTKFGEPAAHSNGLSQVGGEDLSVQQQQQFDVEIACMTREERIRQLSASAEIAAMSVEASEPLLGSRVIRARLVAMDVVANCMRALDHAEKASTSEKKCVQAMRTILRGKPGNGEWSRGLAELSQDAELPPALPEACRLLPLVHAVWPETVLCLRHSHHAVVMRALGLISTMLDAAGGDFMVTRIREDAWPVMEGFLQLSSSSGDRRKRLMSRDDLLVLPLAPVSGTPVISSRGVWSRGPTGQHEAESMSPDALEKVRRAVLKWIIDAATDTRSAGALRLVVSSMVNTVKLFLSAKGHAKPLQAAATSALDALTKLSF
ncbi:hypothetical protein CBR_g39747 [Chara braunii]|uniref:TTI1 C-terminal TPR domain-containing protein n=1 Tax=Chara braunii TaxID=69332 RepID=A0A388LSK4_CHABU|nr:hypothetical protein CBR_g39747 [Chara braunii]|eukprot:GBG85182.1 hypothetical protein CBR_g39747 [Chara braunii]